MQFTTRKRRQPPAIIIVALVDILIVMLIFLMVTTSFKHQPALKLALPESQQAKAGASEGTLVVTIAKQSPYLYLGAQSITPDRLQSELQARVAKDPNVALSIRGDTDAPWGQIVKVMDIAKSAGIKAANASVQAPSSKAGR